MLKFGIIGTNSISDKFCAAAKEVSGVEVTAVYSRTKERGEDFAKRNGIKKSFSNLNDMLSSDIDAVYVASPNFMHKEQSILSLSKGKHVLCEKVMANYYSDAIEMVAAAKKYNKILLEAMRPDFDPSFEIIRSSLFKLGKIRRAHFEYCQYSSRYDNFKRGIMSNAFDVGIGNSALADIGIYPLHFAVAMLGEPKDIDAKAVFLENGFEGLGNITMNYGDKVAEVVYSKITDSFTPSVIEGEDASVVIDKISTPRSLKIIYRDGSEELLQYSPAPNNMVYEISAFRDMALGKRGEGDFMNYTLLAIKLMNLAHEKNGAVAYLT